VVFVEPRDRSHREPEHIPENVAEPVAMARDGKILPAEGVSGHGADLRDAFRNSWITGGGVAGALGAGSGIARLGGRKPVDHGVCGGLGGIARPAAAPKTLAISNARFARLCGVVHEFGGTKIAWAQQPV